MAKAMFAAGCFWGVEESFRKVKGVKDAAVGYAGGEVAEPSYQRVCRGDTGHAETVQVDYDPAQVTFPQLLDVFFEAHDPTQLNRQGPDVGTQYRSAVFVADSAQRAEAEAAKVRWAERLGKALATTIEPASEFWRAEEYHQRYFEKQGRSH